MGSQRERDALLIRVGSSWKPGGFINVVWTHTTPIRNLQHAQTLDHSNGLCKKVWKRFKLWLSGL